MKIQFKLSVRFAVAVVAAAAGFAAFAHNTRVTWYTPDIVRITKCDGEMRKPIEIVTLAPQAQAAAKAAFRVDVADDGAVTFKTADGTVLLSERGAAREGGLAQAFTLTDGEPIYGLGDLENLKLNQRGTRSVLTPWNVGDGVPYVAGVKGWSLYWDNTSPVHFEEKDGVMSFRSEVGAGVDYYFLYGRTGDGCVALMRELTGDVPMVPRWVYGYAQSKERYKSQEETVAVLKRYRDEKTPIDVIVQDWQYWGSNPFWNAMEFTGETFPDPRGMIGAIHGMNAKLLITIWQSFGPVTKGYREMDAKGYLLPFGTWPESSIGHIWPPRKDYPSGVKLYDCYSAEARDIYWNNLKRLHDLGIDGWWMDSTDPDIHIGPGQWETPTAAGPFRAVRDAYPLCCTKGVYEHARRETDRKRCFILTRGACAGQQRYGTTVWSGDVQSTWDMLRKQIPGGLNYSLTGNPHFNCDLGGFFAGRYGYGMGGVNNDAYRELYVRWMQFGAFMPMMRSHGTDVPREVYLYGKRGEPVRDALEGAIATHYALVPYIYSTAWQVTKNRKSFMKPLWFDFPSDTRTWNETAAYLFGEAFLVAPIVRSQYTGESNRVTGATDDGWNADKGEGVKATGIDFTAPRDWKTYLPQGCVWWDRETEARFAGGAEVVKQTTLASIPVYVKGGSIVPYAPPMQYIGEKPYDDLTVVVYPGADGAFTLYEDEGDNYDYEKGVCSEIGFTWDEAARTLRIAACQGSFPGMLKTRTFRVRLAGSDKTIAVTYTGAAQSVTL